MSQNSGQVRVVDPILSQYARGYKQPGLVGQMLFPRAPVASYGGKVIQFGKEAFRAYDADRAPGATTKRIDVGYSGASYAIIPKALEAKVPREHMRDARVVPGIDLASRKVNTVLKALALSHERRCATLSRTAASYDSDHKIALTGTDRWTGSASNPSEDIEVGKQAIRRSIGIKPNVALLGPSAASALLTNEKILDRVKHTGGSVTLDILAKLWGLDRVVEAGAVSAAGSADTLSDVWGDDVILAYVNLGGDQATVDAEEPSYGYTYFIDGMPAIEEPYWEASSKSWIYGVSDDNEPVIASIVAGYLIQNAGAAAA